MPLYGTYARALTFENVGQDLVGSHLFENPFGAGAGLHVLENLGQNLENLGQNLENLGQNLGTNSPLARNNSQNLEKPFGAAAGLHVLEENPGENLGENLGTNSRLARHNSGTLGTDSQNLGTDSPLARHISQNLGVDSPIARHNSPSTRAPTSYTHTHTYIHTHTSSPEGPSDRVTAAAAVHVAAVDVGSWSSNPFAHDSLPGIPDSRGGGGGAVGGYSMLSDHCAWALCGVSTVPYVLPT